MAFVVSFEHFMTFRRTVPQDESGCRGTNQGPAGRTRAQQGESTIIGQWVDPCPPPPPRRRRPWPGQNQFGSTDKKILRPPLFTYDRQLMLNTLCLVWYNIRCQ